MVLVLTYGEYNILYAAPRVSRSVDNIVLGIWIYYIRRKGRIKNEVF